MLKQDYDIENMVVGKVYEITYEIPPKDATDQKKLQDDLAKIITGIINSRDVQYVSSKLYGTTFTLRLKLRDTADPETELGALPVIATIGIYAVFTFLVGLGLKWSVTSVKEVAEPVSQISTKVFPPLVAVVALVLGINIIQLFPKGRGR